MSPQLIQAIKPAIGDQWTPSVEQAWNNFLLYITGIMKGAMLQGTWLVALSCKLFIFFGFYFLHSLSSTNRICRYCVRETIYVEESSAINNNRDITKINLLCNIWCCVATGQRKYQDGRIAWCALPSFLGGETLNGAKTLKVWRIRQSPSFLMINVFHYPWLNRVQANEDSLICITAELRLKARSTGSV